MRKNERKEENRMGICISKVQSMRSILVVIMFVLYLFLVILWLLDIHYGNIMFLDMYYSIMFFLYLS